MDLSQLGSLVRDYAEASIPLDDLLSVVPPSQHDLARLWYHRDLGKRRARNAANPKRITLASRMRVMNDHASRTGQSADTQHRLMDAMLTMWAANPNQFVRMPVRTLALVADCDKNSAAKFLRQMNSSGFIIEKRPHRPNPNRLNLREEGKAPANHRGEASEYAVHSSLITHLEDLSGLSFKKDAHRLDSLAVKSHTLHTLSKKRLLSLSNMMGNTDSVGRKSVCSLSDTAFQRGSGRSLQVWRLLHLHHLSPESLHRIIGRSVRTCRRLLQTLSRVPLLSGRLESATQKLAEITPKRAVKRLLTRLNRYRAESQAFRDAVRPHVVTKRKTKGRVPIQYPTLLVAS